MSVYLPEWQVQQALASNPKLLEIPGKFEGLKLREEQKYLPSVGGYIDLLFSPRLPAGWLVVEVKANPIADFEAGNQVLNYCRGLAKELHIDATRIHSMVAAPGPLPKELERVYAGSGVTVKQLNTRDLLLLPIGRSEPFFGKYTTDHVLQISRRRQQTLAAIGEDSAVSGKSVRKWIGKGAHDSEASSQLAGILRWVSRSAPIFAHQVGTEWKPLNSFEEQWFWLFYSSMDRRGNAALFVRAKEQLERTDLFLPWDIKRFLDSQGENSALRSLAEELTRSGVPLLVDLKYGRLSLPKSICDAATFMSRYGYSFQDLLSELRRDDPEDLAFHVLSSLRKSIYGMGPRSAAQFVRGMVLKGPWRLDLRHRAFLEDTKYNALFAGPARLTIAIDDYKTESSRFSDRFLDGDKAVLSHALWYIRKRYEDKRPLCEECPVAGYCAYYRNSLTIRRSRAVRGRDSKRLSNQKILVEFA